MSQFAQAKVTPEQLEIIRTAAKEAGDLQRKLMAEADVKLLAEFKANPDVVVNEPDRAPFQEATAGVIEKYKGESYGDFVNEVLRPGRWDDGRRSYHLPDSNGASRRHRNRIDRLVAALSQSC
jgi:hypothetical protein